MNKIITRQAKLSELSRVSYITKLAYKIPYKENALVTKSHEPKDLAERFLKKEFFIIVVIIDSKIVGAVRYKFVEKSNLYLYQLAVLKTQRKKGIGAILISEIEKIAKKKGCDKITLDCAEEKKLAGYYQKFGFKIDEIKKHLDHHDVYMSKKV